ncbi:MAG: glycosyltransferase family 39 protein [Acidobacteriota bacterium]
MHDPDLSPGRSFLRSQLFNLESQLSNLPFAIPLVFAAMLAVSWRRWTSLIADSGREMDLPLRLLNGELLYRDVHYLYPPFAPYFNALLYRVFGVHLDVLHAAGILCSALIAAMCYRIARRLFDPVDAALAGVAVVIFCVFKPAGNLIEPYAFAALYGCALALGALLLTLRYAEKRQRRELVFAGVLIGLAAITKQEFALAAAVTVTAALVYLHRLNFKSLISDLFIAGVPAAMIALPVYGWLLAEFGWQTIVEDCHLFYTHLPSSLVYYNAQRTGLDHPLLSLAQVAGAAAVAVAALSAIVLLSDRTRKTLRRAGFCLVCALLAIWLTKLLAGRQWDGSPLRALPIFLAVIIVAAWRRTFVVPPSGGDRGLQPPEGGTTNWPALFIVAVYSFAILARVALRVPSGGAFGSFFLPTSLILFYYLFVRVMPDAVARWTGDDSSARRAGLIGRGLMIMMFVATAIVFGVRYRKNFSYEIATPRGQLFAPRATGQGINEALNFISTHTNPGDAVAVLPEGSDLTFLTSRRMPLRHQILIPGLMSERDEQEAIQRLQQDRVRYVLIVNRPMREFGLEAFGRDFYTQLGGWIEANYRLVKVCSNAQGGNRQIEPQIGDPQFFIKVFERKD